LFFIRFNNRCFSEGLGDRDGQFPVRNPDVQKTRSMDQTRKYLPNFYQFNTFFR
jgi:hypothetical protein